MTINYLLHQQEQLEAFRRDFAKLWESELLPKMQTTKKHQIMKAQQAEWIKFRDAKRSPHNDE